MKTCKRMLGLALVLVMVLSLCACGAKPEKALMGTWRYEMDFANMFESMIPEELSGMLPEQSLKLSMVLTFREDMTCEIGLDREASKASMNAFLDAMIEAAVEMVYLEGEAQGIDRETFNALIRETYGMDMLTYCQQMMEESVNVDALLDEVKQETGKWAVADGKLFTTDTDAAFDKSTYILYTVEGDTLTFTEDVGDSMGLSELGEIKDVMALFPMVWTKQN